MPNVSLGLRYGSVVGLGGLAVAVVLGLIACSSEPHATDTPDGSIDAKSSNDAGTAHDQGTAAGDAGTIDAAVSAAADAATSMLDASTTEPASPITFTAGSPFTMDSGVGSEQITNYVYVPTTYDKTHKTPITLWVWLHGCYGQSSGDVWTVSPGGSGQTWITLAVGGREYVQGVNDGCWNMSVDPARVLTAITEIKKHFNIAPKGVIIGGYSSGGDLTYRTAFYNAGQFAGVLTINTSPFRDTGSSQANSLAAATWKFNVVHVAHTHDTTYPPGPVQTELNAMKAVGFPVTYIEREGGHYDDANANYGGVLVPGTAADIATYLFPHLADGWTAP